MLNVLQRIIVRFWLEPLEQRIIHYFSRKRPGLLRNLILRVASLCANLGRVVVYELRLVVIRLVSPEWSVSYIGTGESVDHLCNYLFPSPPQVIELPCIYLWQAPGRIRRLILEGDLVVCDINQILHFPLVGANYSFAVVSSVKQVLERIDRTLDKILAGMNQTMRRRIRRLQTQGYTYTFTKAQEDFDFFYQRMYAPYIRSRHGERAIMRSYNYLHTPFKKWGWGLILVLKDQAPVCGMLCRGKDDCCDALEMGVLDARFDLVKEGSNVALWWFMLEWARAEGFRRYCFGSTLARIADGVFNFKRQWGTRVVTNDGDPSRWHFYVHNLPAGLREVLNDQGFILEEAGKHYRLLLTDTADAPDGPQLASLLDEASQNGLEGLVMVYPGDSRRMISCGKEELEEAVPGYSQE